MSNKLVQASRLLGTVALLAWFCSTLSTQVESKTSSDMAAVNKDVPGLKTTVFETPKGKISVNIPDDTSASDEITGTVLAEPAGETQEEKAKNEDELNGYVPNRMSFTEALDLRGSNSEKYKAESFRTMAEHMRGMIENLGRLSRLIHGA